MQEEQVLGNNGEEQAPAPADVENDPRKEDPPAEEQAPAPADEKEVKRLSFAQFLTIIYQEVASGEGERHLERVLQRIKDVEGVEAEGDKVKFWDKSVFSEKTKTEEE